MAREIKKSEGVLTQNEVRERMNMCNARDLCFITLRPLTDETRFTLIGENFQMPLLNIYGDAALEAYNK